MTSARVRQSCLVRSVKTATVSLVRHRVGKRQSHSAVTLPLSPTVRISRILK